jgi:hypothetical protein
LAACKGVFTELTKNNARVRITASFGRLLNLPEYSGTQSFSLEFTSGVDLRVESLDRNLEQVQGLEAVTSEMLKQGVAEVDGKDLTTHVEAVNAITDSI